MGRRGWESDEEARYMPRGRESDEQRPNTFHQSQQGVTCVVQVSEEGMT